MTLTIEKLLQDNQLKPPGVKDEDWLYYDIDKLIKTPFSSESSNSKEEVKSKYFLHF